MKKFIRRDENKKKRISGGGWRKPKGITNKMRLNRKGHTPNVRPGYGTPVKGKNLSGGLEIVNVSSIDQLDVINPKEQCVVLGRAGKQKKLDMIKKAEEKNIKVVNLKVDKFKEDVKDFFEKRKQASKEKLEAEKKKAEELKKKAQKSEKKADDAKSDVKSEDEKASNDDNLSDEDLKKKEKEEKDKVLTKK